MKYDMDRARNVLIGKIILALNWQTARLQNYCVVAEMMQLNRPATPGALADAVPVDEYYRIHERPEFGRN